MKLELGFMRKVKDDMRRMRSELGNAAVCKSYGPEFPAMLQQTADILQGNGCSPKHIQAALLSMCGVDAGIIRLVLLGAF